MNQDQFFHGDRAHDAGSVEIRNNIVTGPGASQILLQDLSGNLGELFLIGPPLTRRVRAFRQSCLMFLRNVGLWRAPWKGGAFQWVQVPPGKRSSRKQPEQSWR